MMKPLLQLYSALEPNVVPLGTVTLPFAGLSGAPQSMAGKVIDN